MAEDARGDFCVYRGDPLMRPDLYELIRCCEEERMKIAGHLPALSSRMREMKQAGVVRLRISLDRSSPQIHKRSADSPGAEGSEIQGHDNLRPLAESSRRGVFGKI